MNEIREFFCLHLESNGSKWALAKPMPGAEANWPKKNIYEGVGNKRGGIGES